MKQDYGFRGFFELRTPQDLLRKLAHDYGRLKANPIDSYAAFDFFVTANHMVDWVWPSASKDQQRVDRRADALPRVCEHLGDGAKHFLLTSKHAGVDSTVKAEGAFGAGFEPTAFNVGDLIVTLEPNEASELGQKTIRAVELAERVLEYWARRVGYV